MISEAVPVRLSYAIVTLPIPALATDRNSLRIVVTYASGRVYCYRQRFATPADATHFIARFYPDLVGKLTSVACTLR